MDIDFQRYSDKSTPSLRARRIRMDMVKKFVVSKLNKDGEISIKKAKALVCAAFGLDSRKVMEYLQIFIDAEIFVEVNGYLSVPFEKNEQEQN